MSITKGGSRKTIKNISKLKTTKKKTISNTTKKEGGGGFDFPKTALRERNNTKVGSKNMRLNTMKAKIIKKTISNNKKGKGRGLIH